MSLVTCLFVTLGGACGTLARYLLSVASAPLSRGFPWGTIAINLSGSFLIALVGTLTLSHGRHPWSENARLFVMVGFCGGYTTFSSFSLQTLDLLRGGALLRACLNVTLSVLLCVTACTLGHLIGAHLNGGARDVAQLRIEEEG